MRACLSGGRPACPSFMAGSIFSMALAGEGAGCTGIAVPLGKLQSAAVGFGNLPYQLQAGAVGGGSRRQGRLLLGRGSSGQGGCVLLTWKRQSFSLLPKAHGDAAAVRVVADAVLHQIGQGAVQQGAVGLQGELLRFGGNVNLQLEFFLQSAVEGVGRRSGAPGPPGKGWPAAGAAFGSPGAW